MQGVEAVLAGSEELALLTPEQRSRLAEHAGLERYQLGQVVFREGDPGETFYIVYSGRVRVVTTKDDREVTLATLGPDQSFGEIALVTDSPRTATVRAAARTTLVTIRRGPFLEALKDAPALRALLARQAEERAFKNFIRVITRFGGGLKEPDLARLRDQVRTITLAARERLPVEPGVLYVVGEGALDVLRGEGGRDYGVARLEGGETLGEDGIVGAPAGLGYAAAGPATVYALSRPAVDTLSAGSKPFTEYLHERARRCERLVSLDLVLERPLSGEASAAEPGEDHPLPFRLVRQVDPEGNGAAALRMALEAHGLAVDPVQVEALARSRGAGGSLEGLADAAERLGLQARVAQASYDLLLRSDLPAIITWRGGARHAVLHRIDARHAWLADPAEGSIRRSRALVERDFSGLVLLLSPGPAPRPKEGEARWAWLGFARYVLAHRGLVVQIALASLGLPLLGLVVPRMTEAIVDQVVVHRDRSLLWVVLAGLALCAGASMLLSAVRSYILAQVGRRVSFTMLRDFYAHLLRLPLRYFHGHGVGQLLRRFQDNAKVKELIMGRSVGVLLDSILVVVYLGLMISYSPRLTVVALLAAVPLLVLTLAQAPLNIHFDRLRFTAGAALDGAEIETIHGIETVKSLAMERVAFTRWEEALCSTLNLAYRQSKWGIGLQSTAGLLNNLGSVGILWAGGHAVIDGELTIGRLLAFVAMSRALFDPLLGFVTLYGDFQEARVALERLDEVLDEKPEEALGDATLVELGRVQGHVRFEDVSFRYGEDGPWILDGVTCEVPAGKTMAIVGRSGSGKTTLLRLLLGHLHPQKGRVLLDGIDIAQVSPSSLRRHVAAVSQQPFLFNTSIRENITLETEPGELSRVRTAARLAAADGFIESLPLGYESSCGESGGVLSGGQRQRVSIARALYRDPRVLLFDEATSALDTESELSIQRNMQTFLRDRTALVVAHRMSTIRDADRIVVIDGGRIVEEGDHAALMASGGLYQHLCSQQLEV